MKSNIYQEKFVEDNSKKKMFVSGRQGGKTQALLLDLQHRVRQGKINETNTHIIILSTMDIHQLREFRKKIEENIVQLDDLPKVDVARYVDGADINILGFDVYGEPIDINPTKIYPSVMYIDNLGYVGEERINTAKKMFKSSNIVCSATPCEKDIVKKYMKNDDFSLTLSPVLDVKNGIDYNV
jgi:hypothetical protein